MYVCVCTYRDGINSASEKNNFITPLIEPHISYILLAIIIYKNL